MAGTFDELYAGFVEVTSGLDDAARDLVFAGTAERVYRL
jgi:predicted TIM-barrel fold metal-dependent hydrolase